MYDHIKDSYHLLIGNEMVEVPSVLFKKLFEETIPEQRESADDSFERMRTLSPEMMKLVLESLSGSNHPEAKRIYEETKAMVRTMKNMGVGRQLFHYSVGSILAQNGLASSIEDFKRLTDKIYDELEKESGA
jgi:hypothetical protein